MRQDIVNGFYDEKDGSFKGVAPAAVKRLTLKCEQRMLQWLKRFQNVDLENLKDYKRQKPTSYIDMAEPFQFDNSLELGDQTTDTTIFEDMFSDAE